MRLTSPVARLGGSIVMATLSALSSLGAACSGKADVHATTEARTSPCVACHRSAFVAANTPKHEGLFPETCNVCHSVTVWAPIPALHELVGIGDKPCVRCHVDKYDATSKPKHAPSFPKECKDCHSTNAWQPLARDIHLSDTVKAKKCFDCHEPQYVTALNPKHAGALPTTCETCHFTSAWKPSNTALAPQKDAGR